MLYNLRFVNTCISKPYSLSKNYKIICLEIYIYMKDEEMERHMNTLTKRLMTFFVALLVCAVESFGSIVTITVDDFDGLNTASGNDLAITKSENGLELKFGPGTSSLGRDAFGTGTSTFGQTGAWFDGSYAKFGNSGNQQQLDIRITNNTGNDAKLTNIAFDIRKPSANANPTDFQLLYLATGDSALIKGPSVAAGSEMVNLAGLGADTIAGGINNYDEAVGANISGTAWIADGGYANFRLKINTGNASAGSQLDNFSVSMEVIPEPATIGLLGIASSGLLVLRRRFGLNS